MLHPGGVYDWSLLSGHLELHSVKDHAKAHHAKAQNAHIHMPWTFTTHALDFLDRHGQVPLSTRSW